MAAEAVHRDRSDRVAASIAEPPSASTSAPIRDASGSGDTTMPWAETADDVAWGRDGPCVGALADRTVACERVGAMPPVAFQTADDLAVVAPLDGAAVTFVGLGRRHRRAASAGS